VAPRSAGGIAGGISSRGPGRLDAEALRLPVAPDTGSSGVGAGDRGGRGVCDVDSAGCRCHIDSAGGRGHIHGAGWLGVGHRDSHRRASAA